MKTDMGREAFDAIPIPAELEHCVKSGLRKGRVRRGVRRGFSGLAAAVALVFLTANIPYLYARAEEVPALAPLVRVMRIGNGGEELKDAVPHVQPGRNRIRIAFTDLGGKESPVPVFSAVQRKAPQRVTLRVHGLSGELKIEESLMEQAAVSDAYPLSATDPREQGVSFHLKPGWHCAVSQYENVLEPQFTKGEDVETGDCYVLRSAPLPWGEALAQLTESLLWEGATQLRLPTGEYCVTLGEFATKEQAERAQTGLLESHGVEMGVYHVTPDQNENA